MNVKEQRKMQQQNNMLIGADNSIQDISARMVSAKILIFHAMFLYQIHHLN